MEIQLTTAEEDYLKVIYLLSNYGKENVATNQLAEAIGTKPASTTDMIKKLHEKKLIDYIKYQGVHITDLGKKMAISLLRINRLWKVFLVEKLHLNWDEVEQLANELEHIQPLFLSTRLDAFLDFPEIDPQGNPIPTENGEIEIRSKILLNELEIGQTGVISSIQDNSPTFLQYLNKIGIYPKTKIKVLDKIEYDGTMEIQLDNKKNVTISKEASKNILVLILV